MPQFEVTTLDVAILVLYVIGTRILFGWYYARQTMGRGSEDYFLAGRRIRWPIIGLSFYVANMSGSTFVALPASGYLHGVAVYTYEWLPAFILIFFVVFVLPLYYRANVYTAPEFLEARYGPTTKLLFSGFLLTANVLIDAAAALYAGAMIVRTLNPDIPLWVTVSTTAAIAGIYITFGGLGAVVINDALQAAMILIGGAMITVLAFHELPSWQAVQETVPDLHLHLIQPANDDALPWPGMFTGVLVIGIYFWCSNQFVIQRALGARSLDHGRWGSLLAGALKLPNLFILILPGVAASVLYPDLTDPDLVFPTMAFDLLPVGWRGLMLAALAAAILSSLEAIFNSAATLFTMDFVRSARPQTSDRALTNIGRVATLGFMILSAAWAPQIERFPTLWQYLQSVLAYITPPVVAVFLLGIFWKRANRFGAAATLAVGVPLGLVGWVLVEIEQLERIQFLYSCGISFAASCLLLVIVSLATPAPPEDKTARHVWQRKWWTEESAALAGRPWYANYRYLSLMLAAATGAVVVWWL